MPAEYIRLVVSQHTVRLLNVTDTTRIQRWFHENRPLQDSETSESWLTVFGDWTVGLMEFIGAPGAGIAIALENLFPPLPSELVLPMAGLAASRGSFSLFEALFWTTAGSVVGAYLLYWLGAAFGASRLRAIAEKLPLMQGTDVDNTVAWFERHGGKAVFFGRMIPIFRSLISIPAGVTRMPLLRFGALTLAGSLIWNTIFVLAGYFLGENWIIVERYSDIVRNVVIIGVILGLVWFLARRLHPIITARRDPEAPENGSD